MKLNNTTLAAALVAVLMAPTAFAQNTNSAKPLSRADVRSEAITTHKDGTMLHSEVSPKAPNVDRSTQTRAAVTADAIAASRAGTVQRGEAWQETGSFKSVASRQEVRAEAIRSHSDGTMLHSEVTPLPKPVL